MHWSALVTDHTGDGLPGLQPSAGSACSPGVLPDSPGTNRLPNSLHPAVQLVTQAVLQIDNLCALSLCLNCLFRHDWESPAESSLRNGRFSTGERGKTHKSPSPQPHEAAHTVAYVREYAEEGDSTNVPSPNARITCNLRGSKGNTNR